ncbi:hypothetical protein Btru_044075 [Bulinus truncatus]|nr:hypothetical protein Btru_044075 [Bulinus truncatus]
MTTKVITLVVLVLIANTVFIDALVPANCLLPNDAGPCKGTFKRFYYDTVVRNCVGFTYTGCGGNNNRFESVTSCQQTCTP